MDRFSELPCEARMMVMRYTPHPVSLLLSDALEKFARRHSSYHMVFLKAARRVVFRNSNIAVLHHNWMVRRRRKIVETRGDVFRSIDLVQWAWCHYGDWAEYYEWRARSRSPRSSDDRSASRV